MVWEKAKQNDIELQLFLPLEKRRYNEFDTKKNTWLSRRSVFHNNTKQPKIAEKINNSFYVVSNKYALLPGRTSSTAGGIEVCALSTFRFNGFKDNTKNNNNILL